MINVLTLSDKVKLAVAYLAEAIADHRASGGGVISASHYPLPGNWRTLENRPMIGALMAREIRRAPLRP